MSDQYWAALKLKKRTTNGVCSVRGSAPVTKHHQYESTTSSRNQITKSIAELGDLERGQAFLNEVIEHYQTGDWERVLENRAEYKRAKERLEALRQTRDASR